MEQKYNSLQDMLQNNSKARSLYNALPMGVQEQISEKPKNIDTYKALSSYASNIYRSSH